MYNVFCLFNYNEYYSTYPDTFDISIIHQKIIEQQQKRESKENKKIEKREKLIMKNKK